MNFNLLRHHWGLIITVVAFIVITVSNSLLIGTAKPYPEIEWPDAVGEGGIAMITLIWIFFTLISRPSGKVTNLLVFGLLFMHISLLVDVMDEFFRYPEHHAWLSAYESIPAPIGMILLTVGLYHWHREQLMVNEQLRKRERVFREHGLIDVITGLYNADYMAIQVKQAISLKQEKKRHTALAMFDIDSFDALVRQYGDEYCDRLLQELAEIIMLEIRPSDLACRYAGDRFIVLLPDTGLDTANELSKELAKRLAQTGFKPLHDYPSVTLSVSTSICAVDETSSIEQIFSALNTQMERAKLHKKKHLAA